MEVTITSASGEIGIWDLHKSLLSYHSGYFQRASHPGTFKESEEDSVSISDFEPATFKLFIEYMCYGTYIYRDNLQDHFKIGDSAKAWVLGDYLDAIEFKNFAMRNLYKIYLPENMSAPLSGIGPKAIEYCCSNTSTISPLTRFFKDVLTKYWYSTDVIKYGLDSRSDWDAIWNSCPEFRNSLLFHTNQKSKGRSSTCKPIEDYLEKLIIPDEPIVS